MPRTSRNAALATLIGFVLVNLGTDGFPRTHVRRTRFEVLCKRVVPPRGGQPARVEDWPAIEHTECDDSALASNVLVGAALVTAAALAGAAIEGRGRRAET